MRFRKDHIGTKPTLLGGLRARKYTAFSRGVLCSFDIWLLMEKEKNNYADGIPTHILSHINHSAIDVKIYFLASLQ